MTNLNLLSKQAYHYDLPQELIAQYPLQNRVESRLMLVNKKNQTINHSRFSDIINYLNQGDVLVLNTTKVIPARLFGKKENLSGANVEILLVTPKTDFEWLCLVRPGKKLKPGHKVIINDNLIAHILAYEKEGMRLIRFECQDDFWKVLEQTGEVPLPPYITRKANSKDKETYQTVYAKQKGSVAAPTAGLHFNNELLKQIKDKGIIITEVVLHVGLGTFRPVETDDISLHKMHSELCEITPQTANIINNAKQQGRRIIAVGTTSTRTLESFANNSILTHGTKWTDIFIYPGKQLQIIDAQITNFHMPESTLLMLVSAFAGYDLIINAYQTAVNERYRFFSYGDAMFIY
ncbi:MAG: tRNA preQ1(34) S-adenosylmethionine ribosyltransferase-isomerase QueA [Candidatus Cloacimonetes bacterium]|jgi:S-adenosylmethionine:tRNA ribosyltransferase-isomerase|nr:tRNA preQ1(34) S-adenosylmethionine ribosyltransferase-isomerase QueA [Candidatus Cloacimonadota bacterium]MDD4155046.1 tRNA preQ1(34) S-adenosylmethionine ribosyltransferase-isomerase QueA [Candidatus Cloacimonadota bacterium]